jgi:hypothetical protein
MSDHDAAERRLRLRRTLGRRRTLIVAVLLGVVFVGGWLAVTAYAAPGTVTEQRTTEEWSRTGTFTHGATVTEPNPAYDIGTQFRDRSTYLRPVAPVLNVTYSAEYQAAEGGRLNTTVTLHLVRQATDSNGGVLWEVSEPVATVSRTLRPGERVSVPVTLDVAAVANRTRALSSQLGDAGGTETALVAETQFDGRVNGESAAHRFTHRLALGIGGDTYTVSGAQQAQRSFSSQRVVTREREHGPLYRAGGPVLVLAGTVGLAGLLFVWRAGWLTLEPTERAWLAYRDDYDAYADWIHTASLPPGAASLPEADAATLGDLVDIAIDVDETVIEEPEDRRFHVLNSDYRYVYEAPRPDRLTGRTETNGDTGTGEEPRPDPTTAPEADSTQTADETG